MPELPDVEGHRRFLAEHAAGRTIEKVEVPDADLLRNTTPQGLGRALNGMTFAPPDRHGKWLLARTDDGPTIVLHFGMTGYLSWNAPDEARHTHDRVVFTTDRGELRFNCMRKFGGVWLAIDGSEIADVTGPLGPDALAVDRQVLGELLDDRRGGIKSALMDQALIAGLGNLLADEILWQAAIHPRTAVGDLQEADLGDLHASMRRVRDAALPTGRVPPRDDWLTGARDDDEPHCPRCGTRLEHGKVNSRSTWWCPRCQP